MSEPLIADWLAAGAAVFAFFTATAALFVAANSPKQAAEWAETYRKQSE